MTKAEKAEQEKARDLLRTWIEPGDTVYTVLRSVPRSGGQRSIAMLIHDAEEIRDISGFVARACGDRFDSKQGGIKVRGGGMDMGLHLVYNLSYVLFPTGFGCIGRKCPSNDHPNGDRDYIQHGLTDGNGFPENREPSPGEAVDGLKAHWHKDGGYALRHRWI